MYYGYELFFGLISIIFSIALLIDFLLNKKNLNKISNIYFGLIINSILMSILSTINNKMLHCFTDTKLSLIIISKLTIASMVSWIVLFTLYIVVVSFKNNVKDITKVIKRTRNNLSIMYIIYLLLLVFIPINYMEDKFVYIDSKIIGISYLFSFILLLMGLVSMIINRNNISKKIIVLFTLFSVLSLIFVVANSYLYHLSLFTIIPILITSIICIDNRSNNKTSNEENKYNDIEFISNASCEISSSLNNIVNCSNDLLNDNLGDNSKKTVNNIITTSEDLIQLTNSLSDVIKIENNMFKLNNQEYNLKEIFDEIVLLANNRIDNNNIQFKYEYDNNIPPVLYGDANRIKQVMLNILINSIKYTNSGYIKYNINCEINNDRCCLNIVIEDTGTGIKEEEIDELFTKFDDGENTNAKGIGLGIPVTKKIVEFMDGKIQLQSKSGVGSKFEISFEQRIIPKQLEDIKKDDIEEINFVGAANKVLIIDDEDECINQLLQITKSCNLSIETDKSGINCINKILDGNKYELLFIDTSMEGMDGIHTLKNLKNIIGFNTPVVALIESNELDNSGQYIEEGFSDYLLKPINKNKLFELLSKYLNTTSNNEENIEGENDNMSLTGVDLLTSNGVNIDASLELLGDMDMYNDTAKDFLKESETRLKNIEEFKNSGDMPNYAILVHAMKSDSKYLGFTKLAELSYNHEMASKGNDINYVNNNYEELMIEANRIINLLKQYIGN